MRAAIYCRVSTDGQEDNTSLSSQEASCRAFAAEHGMTVVAHDTDVYTGSKYRERQGLSRLRALVRSQQVDAIVCHAIDRLSRNQAHLYIILEEAEDAGVDIHFVTEVLEDSAIGRFIQAARAFAAEVEREKIAERTNRGKREKLLQGKAIRPSRVRFGLQWDEATSTFTEEPYQASVVRRIYDQLTAERMSARQVVRWLNEQGIAAPMGGHWVLATILDLIRNPVYKGELISWRTTRARRAGKWVFSDKPESEWVYLPAGTAPVIVAPEIWAAAQAQVRAGSAARTRNARRPALLRSLITCQCGCRYSPEFPRAGNPLYRCTSRNQTAALQPCGTPMIRASDVEAWAWDKACRSISGESRLERVARTMPVEVSRAAQQIAQLEARISEITAQQERLLTNYRRSQSIPWSLVEGEISRAEDERTRLLAQLAPLVIERQAEADMRSARDAVQSWAVTARANLTAMSWEERRHALETIGARVTVSGRTPDQWTYEDDL